MTHARVTAEMRRTIAELVREGCSVVLKPDGTIMFKPKPETEEPDERRSMAEKDGRAITKHTGLTSCTASGWTIGPVLSVLGGRVKP